MGRKLTINNSGEAIDKTQFYGIIDAVQVSIYWKNIHGVYLGCNDYMVRLAGKRGRADIIGKTDYDMPWKNAADEIKETELKVISGKKIFQLEEISTFINERKERVFLSTKSPLLNDKGNIIGVVGSSIDITDSKKAQALEIETAAQKAKLEEQQKFEEVVKKVAHDICSPLATLQMYLQVVQEELSDKTRLALASSVDSIRSTADGILSRYKRDSGKNLDIVNAPQKIVLSLILSQIESEKKYEYKDKPINFNLKIEPKDNFTSIEASSLSFRHMISNLINNSVDAYNGKKGVINLRLESDAKQVKIIVEDKGRGMPQKVIEKILNREEVTYSKANGHGIGMKQIQDTLEKDNGVMTIDSKVGKGTKITLTYLKTEPPEWIAQKIEIRAGDTIIILDDELTIHEAWDIRFKEYEPKIKIKHFISGIEAEEFINSIKTQEYLLLLSDFRLIKQKINGLQIIEKTKLKRAVLVTSYYTDRKILNTVNKLKIKVLPKVMMAEIPIEVV